MGFNDIVRKEPGRAYMLTNEAVVRGALEADVKVLSFYPGSPTVEILETFDRASTKFDYEMEISVNEKVALETVAGASMVGQRSFTSMKSVGMNVASDALYSLAYTGLRGGCVCLMADDPHCHSSQSEQDGRWFGYTSYLPMLEPSDPQEALEMTKAAFEISERFGSMVLIRTTTRVNHQTGLVQTNLLDRKPFEKRSWKEEHRPFVTVKAIARENKVRLLDRIERMRHDEELIGFNRVEYFDGVELQTETDKVYTVGIVTAGVCYRYVVESLMKLGARAKILKVGTLNPLPEAMISDFLLGLLKIVIVEELSPYLENTIKALAKDHNPDVEVMGKGGHFSEAWEYNLPMVMKVLAGTSGKDLPFDHEGHLEKMGGLADDLPPRVPVFCPGCPHRATIWSLLRAVGDKHSIFHSTDIGCYSMTLMPPIEWGDAMICMGAGIGMATGAQYSTDDKVIAVIGDSTFFHAGLPGVVNIVHNDEDIMLLVLDNGVTAMTGQQTHPGNIGTTVDRQGKRLDIETVLKGMGIEKVWNMDSFQAKENVEVFKEALADTGPRVVISHGECALYHFRNYRRAGGRIVPFQIAKDQCKSYYSCIRDFMCPAISIDESDGRAQISPDLCVGCGVCAQLCGAKAIHSTAVDMGGEDRPYTVVDDYKALIDKKGGG